MIDYATLVMCSRLEPTWGHVPFTIVEQELEAVHSKQHNIPHDIYWNLGFGHVWEANCGAKVTAAGLMRRLGARMSCDLWIMIATLSGLATGGGIVLVGTWVLYKISG